MGMHFCDGRANIASPENVNFHVTELSDGQSAGGELHQNLSRACERAALD